MVKKSYNPDVLTCLANLSSDEVFTLPHIANQMLDLLPQELFRDKNTTFLDPVCKSGVFLREIAKRLMVGLENEIPNDDERRNHIFKNQLFGIGITELTSLLSRRSVYCSKTANGEYSVAEFDDEQGNIKFERIEHTWVRGKCSYCGANQNEYERGLELETHAYQFIHTDNPETIFNMRFDVIIGNPPYQIKVNEGGKGLGAIPLYHKFIDISRNLKPSFITMIIPSRWFAGGVGLNEFRSSMLSDRRISKVFDFIDSRECFPNVDINGGVCYFLWDFNYDGECEYHNVHNGIINTRLRKLDEYEIFIRNNNSLSIIKKILTNSDEFLSSIVSSQTPFGLLSTYSGHNENKYGDSYKYHSSKGVSFALKKDVTSGFDLIDKYKILLPKVTSEHGGQPNKEGKHLVLSRLKILNPNEICSQSYLVVGGVNSQKEAVNLKKYLETKFVRYLLLQSLSSMNISKDKFRFVPMVDFNKSWNDSKLNQLYSLNKEEINDIEQTIRPMGGNDE
jgi:site-specific DNA-methyltransferase (adenine-specific)